MKLLDLFCGEGGAAAGYIAAGWDVTGVDIKDTGTRYPGDFIRGDALAYLATHGHRFDAIHASPPCQGYSIATAGVPEARAKHRRFIAATRELLALTGRPWVIENVQQARSELRDPILLCGRMFGLGADDEDGVPLVLDRHRLFESNVPLAAPSHPKHDGRQVAGVYTGGRARKPGATAAEHRHDCRVNRRGGYVPASREVRQRLLGIDWMTDKGMAESIPPAFTEHIGRQLLAALESGPSALDGSSRGRTGGTSASPGRRTGSHPSKGAPAGSASFERSLLSVSAGSVAYSPGSSRGRDATD